MGNEVNNEGMKNDIQQLYDEKDKNNSFKGNLLTYS